MVEDKIETNKFIKKPEIFEVTRWTGDNFKEMQKMFPKCDFEIKERDVLDVCNQCITELAVGDVLMKSLLNGNVNSVNKEIFENEWMLLNPNPNPNQQTKEPEVCE